MNQKCYNMPLDLSEVEYIVVTVTAAATVRIQICEGKMQKVQTTVE